MSRAEAVAKLEDASISLVALLDEVIALDDIAATQHAVETLCPAVVQCSGNAAAVSPTPPPKSPVAKIRKE